jgi:hypothetical protein
MEYFGRDGDRMHMMFNFQVNQYLFYALASADTRPLAKALAATKPRPAGRARSHFRVRGLSANHHLFQRVRCVTLSRIGRPAAIVIFWPAAFFVGGDKQTAAELLTRLATGIEKNAIRSGVQSRYGADWSDNARIQMAYMPDHSFVKLRPQVDQ